MRAEELREREGFQAGVAIDVEVDRGDEGSTSTVPELDDTPIGRRCVEIVHGG